MINRVRSIDVLGVSIHANMDIGTMQTALNTAITLRPQFVTQLTPLLSAVTAAKVLVDGTRTALQTIKTMQDIIKALEKALRIGVKAYGIGVTIQVGLTSTTPVVPFNPINPGAVAILTPLDLTLQQATDVLQTAKDNLDTALDQLQTLVTTAQDAVRLANQNVMITIGTL